MRQLAVWDKVAGDQMKLFLKRNDSEDGAGFTVFDEKGYSKYTVDIITEKTKQRITIKNNSTDKIVSEILRKELVIKYFTVKCRGRIYILVPYLKDCFTFMIYGSTYRFAGDVNSGRFSLFDVDKSPVMTQKKCWSPYGDAYELELYDEIQEYFSLSVAVCAAMFISSAETGMLFSE